MIVPETFNASLIVTAVESSDFIEFVVKIGVLSCVPATTTPVPLGVMLILSFDLVAVMLLSLIVIPSVDREVAVVAPVIVNVSPDTAVVMFVPPAILIVSPVLNTVPEESYP